MTLLPEPQKPAELAGQPLPGWPTVPLLGDVELARERGPVKWVPDAYGRMVPMPAEHVPPLPARTEPRDLAPIPLIDPVAQRFVAAGIGVGTAGAGVGWGFGQALAGLALGGTSGLLFLAAFLLLTFNARGRARTVMHIRQETHIHQKWGGRTSASYHN